MTVNAILNKDIVDFVNQFPLKDKIEHTKFLITGATGLIGSIMIHSLIAMNLDINIISPVRNLRKALGMFNENEIKHIEFLECDLSSFDYDKIGAVDFIVHCAAPTASKYFVEHPVETFNCIVKGTQQLLEYARYNQIKSFVYLSSLEVYGTISDDFKFIKEDYQGYVDPMSGRSSYPIAKRASENLCISYFLEYNVPVRIARLTQTTGAGVAEDDNRVIVQFSRLASQRKDIILHSLGNSARPYCYTIDCINAILYILLKGNSGEAYNVANEDTYISAKDLAFYIKENFSPGINVKVDIDETRGYAPETKIKLSTGKLNQLGWRPIYTLHDILEHVIASLKNI